MMDNACKKCRREGVKLFLKGEKCYSPKCPFVRRSYAPGQHGMRHKKLSDYALQLREKQKAKRIYGLRETQFKNYYKKAAKHSGDTAEILLSSLERRLDNIVYKSGLVSSRKLSRQLISHGHFLINKKKVTIPSYIMEKKDVLSISPKSSKLALFNDETKSKDKTSLPAWLRLDKQKSQITLEHLPKKEEMNTDVDIAQIIEFYSK